MSDTQHRNTQSSIHALRTLRIIHAAMAMSVLMYGVVLVVLGQSRENGPPPAPAEPTLRYGIMAALAAAGLGLVAFGSAGVSRARALPTADPHRDSKITSMAIVRLAGAETVALGGFVAAFLDAYDYRVFIAPAVIALLAIALMFPREDFFASHSGASAR